MGLPVPKSGYTSSNRWQLDSKTEKVLSLPPGRDTLTNNEQVPSTYMNSLAKQLHV